MTSVDVYVNGLGAYLPARRPVAQAVALNEYDEQDCAKDGYESICISGKPALDMAAAAAESAIKASNLSRESISGILYAHIHRQGPQLWSAASYLQRVLQIEGAYAVRLEQGCNGGMAALELAVRLVEADPTTAALAATGDRFELPSFDRWRADYGIVYGDAGTAAVVSHMPGVARIVAIGSVTQPNLEEMHRGIDGDIGVVAVGPIDLRHRKKQFLAACGGRDYVNKLSRAAMEPLVDRVMEKAGVTMADLAGVTLPNLGQGIVKPLYLDMLGIDFDSTFWRFGRRTGHLGAGDMLAGLKQIIATQVVSPGDRVMLLGAGAGYSFSCAIVEIC